MTEATGGTEEDTEKVEVTVSGKKEEEIHGTRRRGQVGNPICELMGLHSTAAKSI